MSMSVPASWTRLRWCRWCKPGCLSGTGPSRASLPACAGISVHASHGICLSALGMIGISAGCAEYYAVTADYSFNNCEPACLLSWCKSGYLSCPAHSRATLPVCAGIFVHTVTLCLEPPPASCFIDVSKASGLRSAVNSQLLADRSKQNNHCDGGLMDCAVKCYKTVNVAFEITDIFWILEKGRSTLWRLGCHRGPQ